MISEYDILSHEPTLLPFCNVLVTSLRLRGYALTEITGDPRRLAKAKVFIVEVLATGNLKPIIAPDAALWKTAKACRFLECNKQIGKTAATNGLAL